MLRIWGIADNSIYCQWLVNLRTFLMDWPVLFEGISTTSNDVLRDNATHHKVHTSEVVGILLQLLCIVLHLVLALDMLAHCFTDGDKQRTRTRGRVIDFERLLILMVLCHNLRHDHCHLVRSVELTSLLAGIGSEVADKELIDVTQYVIVLRAIGRNILNELDKTLQRLCLRTWVIAQLAETFTQGLEDAVIDTRIVLAHQTLEVAQSLAQCLYAEAGIV